MIIKEKYTKSAKLNSLSGSILFFANKKSEIININNLLNHSQNKLFKKNLKNNIKKKEIFSFDLNYSQKIIIYSIKNNKNSFEKNGAKLIDEGDFWQGINSQGGKIKKFYNSSEIESFAEEMIGRGYWS